MSLFGPMDGNYEDRTALLRQLGFLPKEEPKKKPADLPNEVAVALNFIQHCNQYFGLRGFAGESATEIREQALHKSQDEAFRSACRLVRNYFDSFDSGAKTGPEVLGVGRSRENARGREAGGEPAAGAA